MYAITFNWSTRISLSASNWSNGKILILTVIYLGHKEHYSEDMGVLVKLLNVSSEIVPDSFKSINQHAAKSDIPTTEQMFSNIPNDVLKRIREIYKPDYEIFSYEMPKWLADL